MEQQTPRIGIIAQTEEHVEKFIKENIDDTFVFHDFEHTRNVVESVMEIGQAHALTESELEILQLAAWFHDTGYDQGPLGHEQRSALYAEEFLTEKNYPAEHVDQVKACILATKVPQQPENTLEGILCDADLSHIGKKSYWARTGKLRHEMALNKNIIMSEYEWIEFELNFLREHSFHTKYASNLYESKKQKHMLQLYKQKSRINPNEEIPLNLIKKKKKKSNTKDQDMTSARLGRGVETMYRTTYRTHVNLSSIADNKANIMLSINAIIISIVVSSLVPKFTTNDYLIIPTCILLTVCLVAVVFATLSTRPKVTEGKFTREDIEQKRSNLLFFGNYYNMEIKDFHWGMMEMIKDSDFLYSSMTRDLYFLGKVLAQKYKYLSFCYSVFMYGLIVSVIAFAISFYN